MEAYVHDHPFPTHQSMMDAIDAYPDFRSASDMYVEYGRENHSALKTVYESAMSQDVATTAGKQIYRKGGALALRMNYTAFILFGPFSDASVPSTIREEAYTSLHSAWSSILKDSSLERFAIVYR